LEVNDDILSSKIAGDPREVACGSPLSRLRFSVWSDSSRLRSHESGAPVTAQGTTVRTVVRDCLYLNWAFPEAALPPLPDPLQNEVHSVDEGRLVFGSALLFRHEHLHVAGLPFLRLSYPQFNFRFYVTDHEEVPSIFLHRLLVPHWVVPSSRWLAGQPAVGGRFNFPAPTGEADSESWQWVVHRDATLKLTARQGAPKVGAGPSLGSWERMTSYFRQRRRAYLLTAGGLRSVETSQRSVPIWPLNVEMQDRGLLDLCLPLTESSAWPELYSAWLCPEIPFVFELDTAAAREALRRAATAVATDPAMLEAASNNSRRSAARISRGAMLC
jgi:hypothetical protein